MKLQKNTQLALYSVLEFAGDPDRHVSAAEIAGTYGVSAHHLAKVLAELVRAGILDSVRGAGGGYRFAGNARRLTLMDVIQLFEVVEPSATVHDGDAAPLPVERALATVLAEIDHHAQATFRSITLATMLRLVQRQQAGGAPAQTPAPQS